MEHGIPLPHITHVAQTIQIALAPVFLLAGIGAFLNVCAARLARVIDRSRVIGGQMRASTGAGHDRLVAEIRILDQRIRVVNRAILLCVLSGCMICLVVILLFASEIVGKDLGTAIALLFIASMVALAAAYGMFIVETRLGSRVIHVHPDMLDHEARNVSL